MKKVFRLSMILLFLIPPLLSGEEVVLSDLINPRSIDLDEGRIYITDGHSVLVYSRKELRLLTRFGKKGEGPGEFITSPGANIKLYVGQDRLTVNSFGRVSLFSKSGKFIREMKSSFPIPDVQPLGESFTGAVSFVKDQVRYLAFNLYDKNLKKIRTIFQTRSPLQKLTDPSDPFIQFLPFKYAVRYGRIFINELNQRIHIFNREGKEEAILTHDFPRVRVSEKHRQEVYEFFKSIPGTREMFDQMKKLILFPRTLPPMRDYHIADNRIFVVPYGPENGEMMFYRFDFRGRFQGKTAAPLQALNIFQLYPYTIADNQVYQLVENNDEEWQLRIDPL